jgi:hypothetical protein
MTAAVPGWHPSEGQDVRSEDRAAAQRPLRPAQAQAMEGSQVLGDRFQVSDIQGAE